MPDPIFFASPAELGDWLRRHHEHERELVVGYHKRHTGRPTITWPESVDEALCVGWIDGVRRSLDAERYTIRFTPRKPGSTWSAVNVRRMEALIAEGRVLPAGLAAWERRVEARTAIYSYENRDAAEFPPAMTRAFRTQRAAWRWWEGQPAGYRRTATWWVVSARREETRARRLAQLMDCAARGERLPHLARP